MARCSKHLPGPWASNFALPDIFAVALACRAVEYIFDSESDFEEEEGKGLSTEPRLILKVTC